MEVNRTHTLDAGLVVDTSAYADGDVVGGRLDLSKLCGGGGGGTIRSVLIADDAAQSAALDLYLFDGQPTEVADNAAFASAMTMEDLEKLVGVVSLSSYTTINGNVYAIDTSVNLSHGTGQLWAYLVTNGSTPTFAATDDLTLKITAWRD